ncbi:hypothetical protein AB0C76_15415 [Kitasatospora sp. NPDC048722]|uniref:hypothetical protein n=1 Tax=Kitasatospora sp. NPDC048722 TaxID=3155639 RepID=UPI003406F874
MLQRLRATLTWVFHLAGIAAVFTTLDHGFPARATLGFVIGALLGQEPLADLWFLLTHRLSGARLLGVSYGRDRLLWNGTVAGVPVELGLRPGTGLLLRWGLLPSRAPRLRVWLSATALYSLHAGLGVWLATSFTGVLQGVGIGLLASFVLHAVFWRPSSICSLWAVFVLPFRRDALAHELWAPGALRADRLLTAGRIPEAAALLREEASADFATAHLTPAGLALAEGRYEEAELLAAQAMENDCRSHVPYLIVGMAFVGRADRGEVTRERAGALLDPFLVRLGINDRTLYRGFLPTADTARFQNDPDTAVRVARPLSTAVSSPYWRAQAGCSLAAALIATGRPDEARKALARARRECPGLARVSDLERMLEKAAPTTV